MSARRLLFCALPLSGLCYFLGDWLEICMLSFKKEGRFFFWFFFSMVMLAYR